MSENLAFDPSAPEGATAPSGGQYMTRKDFKLIVLVTIFLTIGMIPVYLYMREKAFKATCVKNINGMMETLILYSAQHDDRFPPLYSENSKGEPDANKDGIAYTWISDIYSLKSDRIDFVCPTADKEEIAYSANPTGGAPIPSTYGFYAPYASYSTVLIDNPDTVVILAETANHGANSTFDPLPFSSTKYDGTVIGWNNSNDFSEDKNVDTHSVTRLAFPGTSNGKPEKGNGRHNTFIYGISASRLKLTLLPNDMVTEFNPAKYILTGHWQEPVQPGKKKKQN
jgi:hypothetical protein